MPLALEETDRARACRSGKTDHDIGLTSDSMASTFADAVAVAVERFAEKSDLSGRAK